MICVNVYIVSYFDGWYWRNLYHFHARKAYHSTSNHCYWWSHLVQCSAIFLDPHMSQSNHRFREPSQCHLLIVWLCWTSWMKTKDIRLIDILITSISLHECKLSNIKHNDNINMWTNREWQEKPVINFITPGCIQVHLTISDKRTQWY